MTDVVVQIAYADVAGFPAGSSVDHIEVTLQTSGGTPDTQNVAPGTGSVTFKSVPDGTYTVTAEAVDANNQGFGTPASGSVTVSSGGGGGGQVTLSLPSTLTATQQ